MSIMNFPRGTSRIDQLEHFRRQHRRADFARAITFNEFGWRNGKALDQADFNDHKPGELPRPVFGVRLL